MKRIWAIAMVLGLFVAGCGGHRHAPKVAEEDLYGQEEKPVIVQHAPTPFSEQMAGQRGITELVLTDNGFEPSTLQVKSGAVVRLHLRNLGKQEHNLVIERFGIATSNLAPGTENYVEFTANAKGEWPLESDAPGTPEPALRGVLKVE